MKEILIYALGVVVCSGVFTLFYRTVMHQRTSFRTARVFLIVSMVAAAVIPAFDIPVWPSEPIELPAFDLTSTNVVGTANVATKQVEVWSLIVLCLYGLGTVILTTLLVVQAVKISRTKRHSEVYTARGYEVAVSAEVESPFSFLRTVYVTQGTPPNEMQQIVLHETSHIRHRHSVEKIFMETLKTLLWFNPFAWIAARLLNEVQEFEADRDVLLGGCTVEEYLPVIFKQVFGYAPEISTALSNSLTKKRFEMMTKKFKHNRHSWLRTVGAVPLVAAMMMLFGFTHRAPEIIIEKPKTTETTTVTVVGYGATRADMSVTVDTVQTKGKDFSVSSISVRSRDGKSDIKVADFSNLIIWLENENKEITGKEMKAIDPNTIESISVLKDPTIVKPYLDKTGKESADGVIVITLGRDDSEGNVTVRSTFTPVKSAATGVTTTTVTIRSDEAPVDVAEVMPTFQGGNILKFREWIANQVVYPKDAVSKNIQGKVVVRFIIEKDGSVSNIETLSSPDQLLTDEAIRVMKLSPKWSAGKDKDGKTVRVSYTLPIDFALSK
jgi:TonB family protein